MLLPGWFSAFRRHRYFRILSRRRKFQTDVSVPGDPRPEKGDRLSTFEECGVQEGFQLSKGSALTVF